PRRLAAVGYSPMERRDCNPVAAALHPRTPHRRRRAIAGTGFSRDALSGSRMAGPSITAEARPCVRGVALRRMIEAASHSEMDMEYRRLGSSGLQLSALSFGAWVTFGNRVGRGAARDLIACAYDHGVNFFDNAETYAQGEAERVMGDVLA